jgi:uncharacterized protein (TIGR03437 family)
MIVALNVIAAAQPAGAQTRTGGSVVVSAKIDPRVRERAQSEPPIPVFTVLRYQPQREIFERAKAASALHLQVAESRYQQAARLTFASAEELRQAREALDAVVLRTRQQAFQDIQQAIGRDQDALEGRLRGLGAARISRYLGINMLTAEIPASAIAALEADPVIAQVFPVEKQYPQLVNSVPALGAPAFWNAGYTGQGEPVGILDSGVRTNHPAFAGVSIVSQVFLTYGSTDRCFADNAGSGEDQQGHGTLVGGVVASQGSAGWTNYLGVAKGLGTLYNLKVAYASSCSGTPLSSDQRDVLAALDWAVANTPLTIFNYSYGSPTSLDDDAFSQAFDQYMDTYGLTVAFAAGDGGPAAQTVVTPAISYNGIAVGNWVSRGSMNPTSAVGRTAFFRAKPDLAAPGTNIFSANYLWDSSPSTSDDFVSATGTSMAAPHIAGSAALLRSAGVSDPLAIKAILINTTDNPGWAADSGWGFTNLDRAATHLYHDTGSLATGGCQFYQVAPSADFRATVTWNRHMVGGTSYVSILVPFSIDAFGRFFTLPVGFGNDNDVVQLSGTDSANGVVGLSVNGSVAGVSSEPFAIAFSGPWTRLSGPQLGVSCAAPPVPSGSSFSVTCNVTNSGDLAVSGELQPTLPAGFGSADEWDFPDLQPGTPQSFTIDIRATVVPGTYSVGVSVSGGSTCNLSASSSFPVTVYPALPPPALLSPGNGATGVSQNPTLTWNASAGATSYDVYLGTATYSGYQGSIGFSVSPSLVANTTGTSYTPSALTPGTLYYWQIVAKNGSGAVSSAVWSFMTAAPQTGQQQYIITTMAGTNGNLGYGGDGGPAIGATFNQPAHVALDAAGNLYIADKFNYRVRKIAPNGIITTVAGNGTPGYSGDGGPATNAQFNAPQGLAVDPAGSIYISDMYNNLIRKVAPDGTITTVAGYTLLVGGNTCYYSGDGGPALGASLCFPDGLALDAAGGLYIADSLNEVIRKIFPNGTINTVAGGTHTTEGDGGPALGVDLEIPFDVAVGTAGNWYIAQSYNYAITLNGIPGSIYNNRIRKVNLDGIITTLAGGWTQGNSGDGGPAADAELEGASIVAADDAGNVYIPSDYFIRKVDTNGIINAIAGGGNWGTATSSSVAYTPGDGGMGTDAFLLGPGSLVVDSAGEIFFVDGSLVRVLLPVGTACQYGLDQTAVAVPVAGGVVPIGIRTGQACSWVVSGLPTWMGGNVFGSGPATFNLLVTANPGLLRTATISVAGIAVAVMQGAGACSYSFSPGTLTIPSDGGAGSITVTADPGCPWAASTPVDWATFTGPTSGIGNGTLSFSVQANNTGAARTGAITITGQALSVTQSGAPPPQILANGIVNSATFKVEPLSPGAWFSIFGLYLGSAAQWTVTSTLSLGGASVTVCGQPAVLSYSSGPLASNGSTLWQINALMPDGVAGQTSCPVVVTVNGQISPTASVVIEAGVMELFGFTSSAGPLPIVTHLDYSLVGPASAGLKPAQPGETLVGWGTGDCSTPVVTVGGANAPVGYSGRVAPGLCQLNFTVPSGLAGQNPLRISTSPSSYVLWLAP